MHDRRRQRLDDRHRRPDPPAVLGDREHHLGHAVAAGLAREALDQRPVQQAADDRYEQHEPDPQQRQVQARRVALLAELLMPGRQPGDGEDQLAEPGRAEARAGADDQRHHHQPEARPASQPTVTGAVRRAAGGPLLGEDQGGLHRCQPSDQSCSGTSPAACGKRLQRVQRAWRPRGHPPNDARISSRRRPLTRRPAPRPSAVNETLTTRRSLDPSAVDQPLAYEPIAHPGRRRTIHGQRRRQVGHAQRTAGGDSIRTRYCASVTSSATVANDRAATATRARLAPKTASTKSSRSGPELAGVVADAIDCIMLPLH